MAEYAYSRIGYSKESLGITERHWCYRFIEHCATAVGYMTNNLNYLTDDSRGLRAYQTSGIQMGYTAFINDRTFSNGHWGIIFNKTQDTITTIEGNAPYIDGGTQYLKMVFYFWNASEQKYKRSDGDILPGAMYLHKYLINS